METVERDYSPRGVKFFYIYKALAHPDTNGYITPYTLSERLLHVAEAKRKIGSRIAWLCDTMANDAKHTLGDAPNSEFVIDPDGVVVRARLWSRPDDLRRDLVELVGPVENPTSVASLGMQPLEPPRTAPKGVVARPTLPDGLTPVLVAPANGSSALAALGDPAAAAEEPYYVKLRAEIEPRYFQQGTGKLYLGLFLDPLYAVHWNNEVAAVTYQVAAPAGLRLSPAQGAASKVAVPADADPREFLLDLDGKPDQPPVLTVTIQYFACDDAQTFCKPVTQRFQVTLKPDRDGGSRRDGNRTAASGRGPLMALFGLFDLDDDGAIGADELTQAAASLRTLDTDQNGRISREETRALLPSAAPNRPPSGRSP